MAVSLVQGPSNSLVKALNGDGDLLGNVSHDGVDHLALVVSLLALNDILGGDSSLGKIDVTWPIINIHVRLAQLAENANPSLCPHGAPQQPRCDQLG
jgi:hypothetical protein